MLPVSLFLSYSRADVEPVEALERALIAAGSKVWRDQRDLYAGERWPKRLGDAVAAQDGLVLVWSEAAERSQFVELEWCTALALGKPVLPYLMDETPLPAVLRSLHGVPVVDAEQDAAELCRFPANRSNQCAARPGQPAAGAEPD